MGKLTNILKFLIIINIFAIDIGVLYFYKDAIFNELENLRKDKIAVKVYLDFQLNEMNIDDYSVAYINLTSDGKGVWAKNQWTDPHELHRSE
jgi:hypothetical protein